MAPTGPRTTKMFKPLAVVFITVVTFVALLAGLITTQDVVPSAPKSATPVAGVNLTEAWRDLQQITQAYHPYNSHFNDEVRKYLLTRISAIIKRNGAYKYIKHLAPGKPTNLTNPAPVVVWDDLLSNTTFASGNTSVYFEGTNIVVYIRGEHDVLEGNAHSGVGGVLVNAHYDSVASGLGATDDGVGIVTLLQLLSYFTLKENKPKNGVILLFNNGEEDFLNGAKAFKEHPIAHFAKTFVNLEGAGAGGRAVLFRSTDTEITEFYSKTGHPFGSVLSSDGFKFRLIRSQTDYVVFNGELGLRGLDIAFMEPRSRYHTIEDSTRYTSGDSVWHMLSAALSTVEALAQDESVDWTAEGTKGVWFDLFGRGFAVFRLHTLFAISVTLLVVTPLILILMTVLLVRLDKFYLFSRARTIDDHESVDFSGWRGFFRFPIALAIPTAAVIGLAYLVAKINPYIVYSSPDAVWVMMLTAWLCVAWFLLRGADAMRPTALSRFYALLWLYILMFIITAFATVLENNFELAGEYFIIVYFACVFLALWLSYFELLGVPKKSTYFEEAARLHSGQSGSPISSRPPTATASEAPTDAHPANNDDADDDATERTSLLRGDRQTTFSGGYGSRGRSVDESAGHEEEVHHAPLSKYEPYEGEQPWSAGMPTWIWILQFLLLGPINIILLGQVGLLIMSALHQTPADGNSALTIYLFAAILSVLILLPLSPFLHRYTYHIPTFLFLIFIGTLIYNLVAFPFSETNRLKVYFIQQLDLDAGTNHVSFTGLSPYVKIIAESLPSASGQSLNCNVSDLNARAGLTKCSWPWTELEPAFAPLINVKSVPAIVKPKYPTMNSTIDRPSNASSATFRIDAKDTRSCRIFFSRPVRELVVASASSASNTSAVGEKGCAELRLWRRDWTTPWEVRVGWSDSRPKLEGRVTCLWSDANSGLIPAFQEAVAFVPEWAVVSKLGDGLVEATKAFEV